MDKSNSFQKVLGVLFHAQETMGNEIYKSYGFYCCMYTYVDIVGHFAMNLVTMIHHKKYTFLFEPFNFFIFVHSIHRCIKVHGHIHYHDFGISFEKKPKNKMIFGHNFSKQRC